MPEAFISSVSPPTGPPSGGTVVALTGTDLDKLTGVKFSNAYGTSLNIISPTSATVTSPPGTGPKRVYEAPSIGLGFDSPTVGATWSTAAASAVTVKIKPTEVGGSNTNFIMRCRLQGSSGVTPGYMTAALTTDCAPGGVLNPALAGVKGVQFTVSGASSVYGSATGQPTPNPYAAADGAVAYWEAIGKGSALCRVPFEWEEGNEYQLTVSRGSSVTVSSSITAYEWHLTIYDATNDVLLTNYATLTIRDTQGLISTSSLSFGISEANISGTFPQPAERPTKSVEVTAWRVNGNIAPSTYVPDASPPYTTATPITDGYALVDAVALAYPTFTYVTFTGPTPTVDSLSVESGPSTGGTTVVITGTNFVDVTAVNFGAAPAASFTVNSTTQITAVTPYFGLTTVPVEVSVSTSDGGPSSVNADYTFDGIVIPTNLVSVTSEIQQPTSDPTGGLPHKVVITCATDTDLPPSSGGVLRVTATVPTALLSGSGAAALSARWRTVTGGTPGLWSASVNIGTTRVATRDFTAWAANQDQQLELSFIGTLTEGDYDIAVAVTYVVEG